MLISVVIPTRNRCELLRNTIDALLSDEYADKEIVVMDAASTDGTVEMLRGYGGRVRWISERDGGEYFARNKGFELITGQLISFCGDDNVLMPGSFGFAADFMAQNQEVDIMFGQAHRYSEWPDGAKVRMDTQESPPGRIFARSFIRGASPNVMSDTAFFRRRVVDRIGRFDTSFLGADYEFWARAAHAGCRLEMTDRAIIEYIVSMKSQVISSKGNLAIERCKLASRYGSLADVLYVALLFLPRQILVNAIHKAIPWRWEKTLRRTFWASKDHMFGGSSNDKR
jgi:glycosyltransferase involved in cell wall biosynthesis